MDGGRNKTAYENWGVDGGNNNGSRPTPKFIFKAPFNFSTNLPFSPSCKTLKNVQ
jgi:hypothetical protein